MSRMVAVSKPSCRKSSNAESRIRRPVSSALGVAFVDGIDLNVFNKSMAPTKPAVNNYFERVQIRGSATMPLDLPGKRCLLRHIPHPVDRQNPGRGCLTVLGETTNGELIPWGKPWDRQRISGKLRRKFMSVPGLRRIPTRRPQNG